jgi:hypothetical protein
MESENPFGLKRRKELHPNESSQLKTLNLGADRRITGGEIWTMDALPPFKSHPRLSLDKHSQSTCQVQVEGFDKSVGRVPLSR